MDITHEFTNEKILLEYTQINEIYNQIIAIRDEIQPKLVKIKDVYNILIKNNNKKIFLFCLDTFYFQFKVLNIEIDNINRFISLINNRMYADYYKLYNMMITAYKQYVIQIEPAKIYSEYKELEPFHEYPIDDIHSLHSDILKVINQIFDFYTQKMMEICEYNKNKIGISIDSFINTLEYDNNLVNEQIQLHINYLLFFHKTQHEYLYKLLNKITILNNEIDEYILSNNTSLEDTLTNAFTKEQVFFTIIDNMNQDI